jgi:hypothetical protein
MVWECLQRAGPFANALQLELQVAAGELGYLYFSDGD